MLLDIWGGDKPNSGLGGGIGGVNTNKLTTSETVEPLAGMEADNPALSHLLMRAAKAPGLTARRSSAYQNANDVLKMVNKTAEPLNKKDTITRMLEEVDNSLK